MEKLNHTNKLEEQLFAFDKIVTYKTASALLGVKTDETKEILEKFVKTCNIDPAKKLYVTYLLGVTTSEGGKKIIVVDENNYEKAKTNFDNIFIDRIYSLQKSKVVSWEAIFNIDDFLYSEKVKNNTVQNNKTDTNLVTEKSSPKKQSVPATTVKPVINKPSVTNSAPKQTKSETSKTQSKKPAPKQKKNDIKNLFNNFKPKTVENKSEAKPTVNGHKDSDDDDDDEIISKKSAKKRGRIIDDDEDENVPKQMKADILDSDNESEKENVISADEESENERESNSQTDDKNMEVDEPANEEEEEPKAMETEEVKEKPREIMYQDDEGFFVTEKSGFKKPAAEVKPKTEKEKKEIKQQKKVEKQNKKEIVDKLKKNTNQKTLFNFFKKV